jgi:GxxExxY protein
VTQSNTEKTFTPLTERKRWLTDQRINNGITIHQRLGTGLMENVYEKVPCFGLAKRKISFCRQKAVDVIYDELVVEDGLRLGILVDDLFVIEPKAQATPHPVWEAQRSVI